MDNLKAIINKLHTQKKISNSEYNKILEQIKANEERVKEKVIEEVLKVSFKEYRNEDILCKVYLKQLEKLK